MIEIKKDEASKYERATLLFIDGVLMDKVQATMGEGNYVVTTKDSEISQKIATYSLSQFPLQLKYLRLNFFPNDLEHLNKASGLFINHIYKNRQPTNEFTVFIEFGAEALSLWHSSYTFAKYAKKMFEILITRNDVLNVSLINIDHARIDKKIKYDEEGLRLVKIELEQVDESRIHSLEVEIPYTSPEIKIAAELERIFSVIREVHKEAVNLLIQDNSIEIRKTRDSNENDYHLFLNDSLLEEAEVSRYAEHMEDGPYEIISFENYEAFNVLGYCSFSNIPERVGTIVVKSPENFVSASGLMHSNGEIRIRLIKGAKHFKEAYDFVPFDDNHITFYFSLDVNNWKGFNSPVEYLEEVATTFNNDPDVNVFSHSLEDYGFEIAFRVSSPDLQMGKAVSRCITIIRNLVNEIDYRIAPHSNPHSIVTSFNFPPEVKIPCEQYLLYFIQFLRDLGVEATSELKHEAGQVLFTVTPVNEREALDKIYTALDIYLNLSQSPISDATDNEIAVQRLESSILRLRSDLKLAAAELQAKNATIEAQQLILNIQKGLLSGEVMINSLKNVTPKPKSEDREEFLNGVATLTVLKKEGIEINLPKIYRWLKDLFVDKE
jgi:hypothetical protein